MAENRLFQMVYLLLEKGSMTAPELAKRFEVSVRTIYRDIDILSAAGIPVYTTQGKGGGIFIQENFVLNKSLISEQEQKQILMALQGIQVIDAETTDALFSKLSGVFQKQNVNWIEVDFTDWKKDGDWSCIFDQLKSAIFQNKIISFTYYGVKGEASTRVVEPLKLVLKNMNWYLYGYCKFREDYRLFKLTRIKELKLTSSTYTRPIPLRIFDAAKEYKERLITVTLKFDKEIAYRVYDEFLNDSISICDDGSFLVNSNLPDNEKLFSYLLSFGDQVEVISPRELRNEILARVKKIQQKYIT